jgi:hypothetical protein
MSLLFVGTCIGISLRLADPDHQSHRYYYHHHGGGYQAMMVLVHVATGHQSLCIGYILFVHSDFSLYEKKIPEVFVLGLV